MSENAIDGTDTNGIGFLAHASAKARVLVVDDTPANLALISGLLTEKYKLSVANSGEKALRLAAGAPAPDLILLDVMMPVMDGYEVCRRLKSDPQTRDIPVIFLTANRSVEDEKLGFDLGAVSYTHLTLPTNREV